MGVRCTFFFFEGQRKVFLYMYLVSFVARPTRIPYRDSRRCPIAYESDVAVARRRIEDPHRGPVDAYIAIHRAIELVDQGMDPDVVSDALRRVLAQAGLDITTTIIEGSGA